jgi:aconitate hydratase
MVSKSRDTFKTKTQLTVDGRTLSYFSLPRFAAAEGVDLERLPYSLRILLENLLRNEDDKAVSAKTIRELAAWDPKAEPNQEIAFYPARVVLQDFTGVPAVVDLAALRDAVVELGGDPKQINPLFPSELVVDHSVQVDSYGRPDSLLINTRKEYERNTERYTLLGWAQAAFDNFKVVPPETGIVHQVNLEYLARVVFDHEGVAYPDTLVGTDSHTTMINGLGVLGWGVGGIEAEAAMLGQPINLLVPQVLGFRLKGSLPAGATATDLVLTITQQLRAHGVVGKFVEFFGAGLEQLPLSDRATISNMSPEFGSTIAIFPIDEATLDYLRLTGRSAEQLALVEAYAKAQGLFRSESTKEPSYTTVLELDLGTVVPTLAGPGRPHDKVALTDMKATWEKHLATQLQGKPESATASATAELDGQTVELKHGSVVIAAITSCTNTSNPSVMLAAGLVAQKARARGLTAKPWVKTSLAPGSKVVTSYLEAAGLLEPLSQVGFFLVGYGCTTCIGNSGPLPEPVSAAIAKAGLTAVSVLSGNRNFEGRISPDVRANYLASPPLVVAYALAGRIDIDWDKEPVGQGNDGKPVFLKELWPTPEEVESLLRSSVTLARFREQYRDVFRGNDAWRSLKLPSGDRFAWDPSSTYVRRPTFLENIPPEPRAVSDIKSARVLAKLGDFITTDHISPAGNISKTSPAARYLTEHGVRPEDFNSYGARRGNHEVMVRGTFANVRLRNQLAAGTEGGVTRLLPEGDVLSIYDAAVEYQKREVPVLILAGREYGSGSSRDWAAKGTQMLGVKAVIAQSYERIHRSNLIGMGVLPLQFLGTDSADSLGLSGEEEFDITGIAKGLSVGSLLSVTARREGAEPIGFQVLSRIDTLVELDYFQHGGIIPFVFRGMLKNQPAA